ncbi:MAG: transglycosylase domain-containing protein [Pseudomonadota bacterium]|nr:transglycosylase domain-containing protein [Pseudomonadota bacterium]
MLHTRANADSFVGMPNVMPTHIAAIFAIALSLVSCGPEKPWLDQGVSKTEYEAYEQTIEAAASFSSLAQTAMEGNRLTQTDTPEFVELLIAVEDPDFRKTSRSDTDIANAKSGTITQEVARRYDNLLPEGADLLEFRTGIAKGLAESATKEEILALYLSDLRYGGIEEAFFATPATAARTLYDKPIRELDRAQMIVLVAALHYRKSWNPKAPLEGNMLRRIARIEAMLGGKCSPLDSSDKVLSGCEEFDPAS